MFYSKYFALVLACLIASTLAAPAPQIWNPEVAIDRAAQKVTDKTARAADNAKNAVQGVGQVAGQVTQATGRVVGQVTDATGQAVGQVTRATEQVTGRVWNVAKGAWKGAVAGANGQATN
ncbi:hypothetical protein BKA69DRAFT_1125699 [Paraphysoderma sedebokerense]|nr:hypothetical protein BKA69DRAFT_1125699 [Paraphysoderma sedebokerense]